MHLKTPLLLILLFLAAGEAAATTLTATPAKLTQSDREITIRWSDLPDPDGLDHVAIYSPPSSSDRDFLGYIFLNGSASWRSGRGELALPRLPNLRAPYQFRLFRWPAKEYSYHHVDHDGNPLPHGRHRVAVSADVAFDGSAARPEQVHLAFADGVDEMRVMFVCADAGKRSVRYGLGKEQENGWTEVKTYEQKHMCDAPANDSVGWRDPGFVFDGLMKGLEPGRSYFYKAMSEKMDHLELETVWAVTIMLLKKSMGSQPVTIMLLKKLQGLYDSQKVLSKQLKIMCNLNDAASGDHADKAR